MAFYDYIIFSFDQWVTYWTLKKFQGTIVGRSPCTLFFCHHYGSMHLCCEESIIRRIIACWEGGDMRRKGMKVSHLLFADGTRIYEPTYLSDMDLWHYQAKDDLQE